MADQQRHDGLGDRVRQVVPGRGLHGRQHLEVDLQHHVRRGGTVKANAPAGTTGRYVRLYGTEVATIWGFSIFELEVR